MKKIYYIPVGNLSIEDAEKSIAELMNYYKDDFSFDKYMKEQKVEDRKKKLERIYGKEELDNGRY